MIYTRNSICEPGIRQSVSQVSLKLIRDPLRLGLTPLQHLQPAARVQFGQGTLVFGCSSALGLVWQEHQQGGLASNPPAQWSLVVAKPDFQHGIRRCDQFSGGRKHFGALGPRL